MEANASPIKATPGRRRHPRGGKPAPLKAYASENDAASYAASARHKTTPQTPKKMFSAFSAAADSHGAELGAKQRNRSQKQPKGKNDPASPNYHLSSSQSPPRTSPTSKATSSTPFAGATFHASPAPSDLPIPSFLKSSSESPMVRKPRGVVPQPSPPATDSEVPTPYRPIPASQHRESPLDFMFRAHREEKARQNSDGGSGTASLLAGAMSWPRQLDVPLSPTSAGLAQNRRAYNRQPSSGIEIFELDGTGGQPLGPAFSTPYQDRIRAARSNAPNPPASRESPAPTASASADASAEDPTEALKRFLFNPQPSRSTASSSANINSLPPRNAEPFSNSQVDGSGYDSAGSIQAMENDLRRILKLDLVTERPPTERRLFTR
ncbi:hypothetical protein Trco_008193 [Trichoderma cornu-damae]|uniref:Proteophosphoglycan 5 n=1 Tax=Trichoderma cornu-damae TaxID=654480 RepID=A0A9P8QIM4_9HYPO|nr:hypothetical protein Trco_008193 [Trichoderma cornu-damae]